MDRGALTTLLLLEERQSYWWELGKQPTADQQEEDGLSLSALGQFPCLRSCLIIASSIR
jgi:hypothetical protein